jgi:hypothetical protein
VRALDAFRVQGRMSGGAITRSGNSTDKPALSFCFKGTELSRATTKTYIFGLPVTVLYRHI